MTTENMTKDDSELSYLRRLKDSNSRTITKQAEMIRNRDHVIAEKDKALDQIVTLAKMVVANTRVVDAPPAEQRVGELAWEITHEAKHAKGIGIEWKARG